jgi:uncharacterized protein (DUF58 family)
MAISATVTNPGFSPSRRFDRWLLERIRRRRGITKLPRTFEYKHIFVLPTIFGIGFGTVLALTAIGGLNFNNNMALLTAFTLISVSLMTMFLAYRNQVGIAVVAIGADPVFAGEPACFEVLIRNAEVRNRYAICVKWGTASEAQAASEGDCGDFGPEDTLKLRLEQKTNARGYVPMQAFNVENRFPFGLFKAWSVIIPDARCLVYPQPAPNPPPLPRTGRGDHGSAQKGDGEHFHGLREYQPGDPLKRVAWRASARHQKLYTREMETPREEACELNWYLLGSRETEEKLAILTAWILRAEHHQIPYSLEMPTDALPASLGEDHRDACLKILALYEG